MENEVNKDSNDTIKHFSRCNSFLFWAQSSGWSDEDIERVIRELFVQFGMYAREGMIRR